MKVLGHIESGFYRSLKAWKGILIVWFSLLILAGAISVPLKGSLGTAFGRSMITEKLANGIDPEVFADLGSTFLSIMASISSGLFYVLLTGFILNAFLTGGLFGSVRRHSPGFSPAEFFKACASGFWSFLLISLTISVIIIVVAAILIAVSAVILQSSETISEFVSLIIGIIAAGLFVLLLPVLLLGADFARAWKISAGKVSFLKAIGSGFRLAFSQFRKSYLVMLFMLLIQGLLLVVVFRIIPGWHPATPLAMFTLFLASQFLFFVRLLFRTWRYAGITSLMEESQQDSFVVGSE